MEKINVPKNIALIGMPGCSKTTSGRILANLLCREFVDTDEDYETVYGEKISETFALSGEEVFRNRESELLEKICHKQNAVIATGGGIVLRQSNVLLLTKTCFIVELYASAQTIFNRIGHSKSRPLLQQMDISTIVQLYEKRAHLYRACAHLRICTDNITPTQAAQRIAEHLN